MKVFEIIDSIRNTKGTNAKVDILTKHKDNLLLKEIIMRTYNTLLNTYIKKIPKFTNTGNEAISELSLGVFDTLQRRDITGNKAIALVENTLSILDSDNANVFAGMILKDLKLGINIKNINKAYGEELLQIFPVMLAQTFEKKRIENRPPPYIVQLKCDGWRGITTVVNGEVNMFTRAGNRYEIFFDERLIQELQSLEKEYGEPIMLDGEVLCVDDNGDIMPRHISSSIVGKAVKGTITEKESRSVYYVVWDILPYTTFNTKTCDIQYQDRLSFLYKTLGNKTISSTDFVTMVDTKIVNSIDEVMQVAQDYVDNGQEGGMVKFGDSLWANKRSYEVLKIKGENDCELIVTGYLHGDANKGMSEGIGSLTLESSDGLIKVSVSSGLTMEDRGYIKDSNDNYVFDKTFQLNKYNGSIVTVRYTERIKDKFNNESLFCCRFLEFRPEKYIADHSNYIK